MSAFVIGLGIILIFMSGASYLVDVYLMNANRCVQLLQIGGPSETDRVLAPSQAIP